MVMLELVGTTVPIISGAVFLLTACTPHPGAGVWVSPGANSDDITRIEVHFDPKVKVYSSASEEPVLQCGWWGIDKQTIEMECVYLARTELQEQYRLTVIGDDTAELYKDNRLVSRLFRQRN